MLYFVPIFPIAVSVRRSFKDLMVTLGVNDVLGVGGSIERRLKNYESRPQQMEMANAVAKAIANKQHLVVEAGTGTGKSFAYLVPAILAARAFASSAWAWTVAPAGTEDRRNMPSRWTLISTGAQWPSWLLIDGTPLRGIEFVPARILVIVWPFSTTPMERGWSTLFSCALK